MIVQAAAESIKFRRQSGHDERVTPDERAPFICGRFHFMATPSSCGIAGSSPAMTNDGLRPKAKQKARDFSRAFAFCE
jgi:hypothetical protein